MEETQKHLLRRYRMHDSGGIILSLGALKELGLEVSKPSSIMVDQYIDAHNERVLVMPHGVAPAVLTELERALFQQIMRAYPVSVKGYMTIDLGIRRLLNWRGGEYNQTLDTRFGGILISKAKELKDGEGSKN